jgi:hypothetical protein
MRRAQALGAVGNSPRSQAVRAVIRQLASADALPGPADTVAVIPPTGTALVRRVPGRNLWVWYRVEGDALLISHLSAEPPVPADG